jgi:haloacetate dehalogenase
MFEDFVCEDISVNGVRLRVRHGGSGPPVVLLHGHPRTHTTWHALAPLLAHSFTVVCPDLRGYGRSSKPASDASHRPYSKRSMANDIAELMTALGHERFAVVGHDRGAYVALRTALDHPHRVDKLVFMGLVPIGEALAHCGAEFAQRWWHWFFFNVPETPERVITADPDAWYLRAEGLEERMGSANYADLRTCVHDPATVHAMLEDYRAGLSVDADDDRRDMRQGSKVDCATLVVIAAGEKEESLYPDLEAIWKRWTKSFTLARLQTGHHIAEEDPAGLHRLLAEFL